MAAEVDQHRVLGFGLLQPFGQLFFDACLQRAEAGRLDVVVHLLGVEIRPLVQGLRKLLHVVDGVMQAGHEKVLLDADQQGPRVAVRCRRGRQRRRGKGSRDQNQRRERPPPREPGDCPNFRGHRRAAMVDENGTVPLAGVGRQLRRSIKIAFHGHSSRQM